MNRKSFFRNLAAVASAILFPKIFLAPTGGDNDSPSFIEARMKWMIEKHPPNPNEFITEVNNGFDDNDFRYITFMPLPILEPLINSVVQDITNGRISKSKNRDLLKKDIEELKKRINRDNQK